MKKVEMEIAINQFLDKWETAVRLRSRPYENPNHKPDLLKKVYNAETSTMKRMTDSLRNILLDNNGEEWI